MKDLIATYQVFLNTSAQHIAGYLNHFIINIEDHYQWEFQLEDVPQSLNFSIDGLENWYVKTSHLKAELQKKLAKCSTYDERFELAEYFVATWGGVATNKALKEKLKPFDALENLNEIRTLEGVSSWSKYLSLRHPDAAIYDSRVAYAINAINYLANNTERFFPIPTGRSPKLALLDIETLFVLRKLSAQADFITQEDLEHRQTANRIKKKFHIPEEITYSAYLYLLDKVALILNEKSDRSKIEMLLFALAPTNIFERLVSEA